MSGGNFRLPSLALDGPFDLPVRPLVVPGIVDASSTAAVSVVVGAARSDMNVCRFIQPEGLVGIQLDGDLPDLLRVGLMVRIDAHSDTRWSERTRLSDKSRELRGLAPAEHDLEIRGRARLIAVQAESGVLSHALLSRAGSDEALVQRVVIDVPRSRLDPSGLLMLGFGQADGVPGAELLPDSLVGVELRRVRVFEPEPDSAVLGLLSTGRRELDRWSSYDPGIGFAVVSPPNQHSAVRVGARVTSRTQRGSSGRRQQAGLGVTALDWAGRRIDVDPRPTADNQRWTFDLPPGTGPVRLEFPGLGDAFGADADLELRAATKVG